MNIVKNFSSYFASKSNVNESANKNEIKYKGKLITVLMPSGMFEVYSDEKGKFVKFDDLNMAKALINSESKMNKAVKESIEDDNDVDTTKPYRTVEPELWVVKIDETSNWSEDTLAKLKEHDTADKKSKIYGIYLVDKAEVTHLASTQGSMYLYWLNNMIELGDNADVQEVYEENELHKIEHLNGGNNDDANMYVSEHYKFEEETKLPTFDKNEYPDAMETEEGYNEYIEHIIDHYKGNPVYA